MPLTIARSAVRSYRTLSPLPVPYGHRRSALCCTGRGFTPPRRYLAPCPIEPGLSSPKTVCLSARVSAAIAQSTRGQIISQAY